MRLIISLCLISFCTLSVWSEARLRPIQWAQPMIQSSLSNFYQVDKILYRSEQPNDKAMKELEKLGIKSIVNLRDFHTDNDEAKKTSLKLYQVEMNAESITQAQVVAALKLILESPQPVLVHCWHGSDRTGTVVAAYRMVVQNWTKEEAKDELMNGGYGYHAIYKNIPVLIDSLNVEQIRKELTIENVEKTSSEPTPKK